MLDQDLIRTLGTDEKITEPGFYNITLERHHTQPCDGVSVTSGVLRGMEIRGPDTVWGTHLLNPERWPQETTKALALGTAMAAMIEGGLDELQRYFAFKRPTDPNKPTAAQLNAHKEGRATDKALASIRFWKAIKDSGKQVLTEADLELIKNMSKALSMNAAAKAVLSGTPEITMAWHDEETDLWCLARPDQVEFSGMVSDFKKVSMGGRPFTARACNNKIAEYGYDMQMAFACEAFEHLTGSWPEIVGLVFQQDKAPFSCKLPGIPEEILRIAQIRNRRQMRRFRECLDSGEWPQLDAEIFDYSPPQWMVDRIQTLIEGESL